MGPEQRGQPSTVPAREAGRPGPLGHDPLDQQGVEVHQGRLQEVEGEHGDFLVFPVGAGELAFLAVVQDGVGAVPVLDDLEPFVDLPAQSRVGEVVADEDGPDRPADFFEGGVGGVLGAAAGEAAQDLFGFGALPSRKAVAYLTSWSYWRAISSQSIGRVRGAAKIRVIAAVEAAWPLSGRGTAPWFDFTK